MKLKHWLDETSDADDLEREILRSGLDPDPSQAARKAVWAGLARRLALPPLGVPGPIQPAASNSIGLARVSSVGLGVGKGFVLGLALYGAASGADALMNVSVAPAPSPKMATNSAWSAAAHGGAVPAPPQARLTRPLAVEPNDGPLSAPLAAPIQARAVASRRALEQASTPTAGASQERSRALLSADSNSNSNSNSDASIAAASEQPPSSQLEAEARALREARAELRRGQLTRAWAMLEATQYRFSVPALIQEREALSIEVLFKTGPRAAAKARALAFLRSHPESPHAEQVRRWASAP